MVLSFSTKRKPAPAGEEDGKARLDKWMMAKATRAASMAKVQQRKGQEVRFTSQDPLCSIQGLPLKALHRCEARRRQLAGWCGDGQFVSYINPPPGGGDQWLVLLQDPLI